MLSRYLVWLVMIPIGLCLPIVALNYSVDPFGIFSSEYPRNVDAGHLAANQYSRLHKAHRVAQIGPKSLILGTSRSEIGLSTEHHGWRAAPVYNLSLSGATAYELLRYFQHARAHTSINTLVLGVDFYSFVAPDLFRSSFSDSRLSISASGQHKPFALLLDRLSLLPSYSTTKQSLDQINGNGACVDHQVLPDGRGSLCDIERLQLARGGERGFFLYQELGYVDIWRGFSRYTADERRLLLQKNMRQLRQLLNEAHEADIDVRMLISPTHVWHLQVMSEMDVWADYEMWKHYLVEMNTALAQQHARMAFPITDFTGGMGYNQESVPPRSDTNQSMRWYIDAAHYTPELGNIILDRILLGQQSPDYAVYGRAINSGNIKDVLQGINRELLDWRQANPGDVREISALVTTAPQQ